MSIFEAYRQRRAKLSAPESVATLDYMKDYLRGGEHWAQGVYRRGDARCLVGAAEYSRVSSIDDAKHWLRLAIAERTDGAVSDIEAFNDRQQSFSEIATVVDRARQLAAANLPAPVAPQRAVEIIPPARPASPWNAAELEEWVDHEPVAHEPRKLDPDNSLRGRLKRDPDNTLRRRRPDAIFD